MNVRINILNEDNKIPQELVEAANGDELIARIFYNRGYKDSQTIKQMLNDEIYLPTQPSEFPNINKAVDRIVEAIDKKEKICIYGDYDVDGVTSTVVLVECLKQFTESVIYHVPDRFLEGYGMNKDVIKDISLKQVGLIITCDCGISNIAEVNYAKELGMDVIITDHHNVGDELPKTNIILNPKLLSSGHRAANISGCAMAYFLALAILEKYNMKEKACELLDMVALSLVADVVSLNGENRYLLKKGMKELFNTKRVGLLALFEIIEKISKINNEEDIAFQIAPRINAAGRMDSARLPVELFLCNDKEIAKDMALKIDHLNQERKRVQQSIIDQAIEMVENKKKNKTVLVLFNEHWHHGIIGIAAGKICETYRKPTIMLSLKEDGSTVVGSARSIDEINIYELLKECKESLLKFGGHSKAAGLSVKKENVENFTSQIERVGEEKYYIKDEVVIDVDLEIDLDSIDEDLYERINKAGPYGEGFRPVRFFSRDGTVINDRKTQKNHHIMVISGKNDSRISAVNWFGEDKDFKDKNVELIYKIGKNSYKGSSNIQLTVELILENSEATHKKFKGTFIDERGKSIDEIVSTYSDLEVFYEGFNISDINMPLFNRHNIKKGKRLVFLSTPVNTELFKEIILLANPKEVILNFSKNPQYEFKDFMLNFMGVVKYVVQKEAGKINLDEFSMKLCVEEGIIITALKYLKLQGKLNYLLDDKNNVHIFRDERKIDSLSVLYEKTLKGALMEKNAYKNFLLNININEYKEYMK